MRVNAHLVSELNCLNEPQKNFFAEIATRELRLQDFITASNEDLVQSLEIATSVRTVQRWITALDNAGLINRETIWIRHDRCKRKITLSSKGKNVQAKLIAQLN